MKVGIMGGTFDPLHIGHLIAAETVREHRRLDEIWFIPTNTPPHKDTPPGATPAQRWAMLNAGIQQHPYFRADAIELNRAGKSYTLDTAKALREQYPAYEFFYIIGADMIQYLPHWHKVDELLQIISFIGLERAGFELDTSLLSDNMRQKVAMTPMPGIEISSTLIRSKCAEGQSIRYLVPESVHDYIKENKLYESR